jgi:hypothetical protein
MSNNVRRVAITIVVFAVVVFGWLGSGLATPVVSAFGLGDDVGPWQDGTQLEVCPDDYQLRWNTVSNVRFCWPDEQGTRPIKVANRPVPQ